MSDALRKAYRLGFEASAEGYNGEYPFAGRDLEQDARWTSMRDDDLSDLTAALAVEHGPVATVVWYDPRTDMLLYERPHKIIDASVDFIEAAPIGTKLYAAPVEGGTMEEQLSKAEAHVKELRQSFDDAFEQRNTAIRERDEAMKALEPFANAADELDDNDEDHYELWEHPTAMNITVGDLRRARSASSNREGGEE